MRSATTYSREKLAAVEHLPSELSHLWAHVSDRVEADHGQLPLHTNILTLIAVAAGRHEQRIVRETLAHLAEVQPSRAIAVYVEPTSAGLTADVSANCHPASDGRVTCYEVIELRLSPDRLGAVPSVLAPLELFDLPTFIWWVGEVDLASDDFHRIVTLVERVIIDTSRFEDAVGALRSYHQFLGHENRACTATDLTWARATSWRELIAQSFDNPMARELLWGVQNVEIDFDPSGETQALLLAGWLGSRLGWTPVDAERRGATTLAQARSARGGVVTVALNRQMSAGVGLRSIRLLARGTTGAARTTIRRRDERLVSVAFETAGMRQERVIPDLRLPIPDLVSAELLVHTRDRVFEDALGCAVHWLEMIEGAA